MLIGKIRCYTFNDYYFSWLKKSSITSFGELIRKLFVGFFFSFLISCLAAGSPVQRQHSLVTPVVHDSNKKNILISVAANDILLRVNYDHQCTIDLLVANGIEVLSASKVYSGIQVAENWFTTS